MINVRLYLFLGLLCGFSLANLSDSEGLSRPEWDNLDVLQINREEPRTTMMIYPDKKQARVFDRERSDWFQSLNGKWQFHWAHNPEMRPLDFYKKGFDDSSWESIPVPSNWEIEGHGVPLYANSRYPFDISEKRAPHDWNPVGSYRRHFVVPEDWDGRQVFLGFDGVASAFYVWVNGEFLGYSQGSRTLAEFDVTELVKEGVNEIAVQVYKWSDGSYLEDQDFWRLAGIYRDVYLWSTPQVHLRDFLITSSLDDHFRHGIFDFSGEIALFGGRDCEDVSIELELYDPEDRLVHNSRKDFEARGSRTSFEMGGQTLQDVRQWNAEQPYLYDLFITLRSREDEILAVIPKKVGFRRVEITDGRFLVNGQPVRLRGVNRHEHSQYNAHHVTRDDMMNDIKLLKKNNVNAVRTAHYPNHPLWYKLTDEFGLYVINEGNIETHEFGLNIHNKMANNPDWEEAHVERVERMIYRDRNHPSVVIWSLGNEAGDGPNMEAVFRFVQQTDSTRPFHYEGTTRDGAYFNADIGSFMYASPERVSRFIQEQPDIPLILCEYTHAMGNSNGHLSAYWDLIYADNNFQGAFVWDWMDQGLRVDVPERFQKTSGQQEFIAYGGWFEDPHGIQHDGNFNMNGLLAADLTPHPGLKALKYYHQHVQVVPSDLAKGRFQVTNRFDFLPLDEKLDGYWELVENGEVISSGRISGLNIGPWETREVSIPLSSIRYRDDREYHVNFIFTNRYTTFYASQGYELAWEQFKLPFGQMPGLPTPTKAKLLQPSLNGNHLTVAGEDFHVVFDVVRGRMESYNLGTEQVILAGPHVDFWRAATDNDRGAMRSANLIDMMIWRGAHHSIPKEFRVNGEQVTSGNFNRVDPMEHIQFELELALPAIGAMVTKTYEIYQDGTIDLIIGYQPGERERIPDIMPRFGSRMELAPGFENIAWYGPGTDPTYVDRNVERVGIYSSTVSGDWVDYSRPQENGNKMDVRWITFTDNNGLGIRFTGDPLISTSASHYHRDDMERSRYSWQMEPRSSVFVNIDYRQMGVGGYNSWSPRAYPEPGFRVANEHMSYRYRIEPVR